MMVVLVTWYSSDQHDLQGIAANRATGEVCVSGHCNANNIM